MSSSSFPEATPSPTAAAATPRTASKWEYGCPSPIHSLFGLTTYYSPLTCPVAGTQTKLLVSRSPLRSRARTSEPTAGIARDPRSTTEGGSRTARSLLVCADQSIPRQQQEV